MSKTQPEGLRSYERRKQRLGDTFQRVERQLRDTSDFEFHADMARYLCVLTSGYYEASLVDLLATIVEEKCGHDLARYVSSKLDRRLTNVKKSKLEGELGRLAPSSWGRIKDDPRIEQVDSLIVQRHHVAHGRWHDSSLTMIQVQDFREAVDFVLSAVVADLCE